MSKITIDGRVLRGAFWALVAIGIVAAALAGAVVLVKNKPKADTVEPEKELPAVRVEIANRGIAEIELNSQGEVTPLKRTMLSAEVGGRLDFVNRRFEPGEVHTIGGQLPLLGIDSADYLSAFETASSAVAEAELALELEKARQVQALRDWKKLGGDKSPSALVKREPQLKAAVARITAAKAARDKAQRDLDRTKVWPPYTCRIERTYVDDGAVVAPGMRLADVVSLGPVEVRLPLSLEDYGYLQRDAEGAVTGKVVARAAIGGVEREWTGSLVRSEEIVERTTRSIHVIAQFGLKGEDTPPIGLFVKAAITGEPVKDVIRVSRAALIRTKEARQVVVVDANDVLQFKDVEVMRTEAESVLVSGGLEDGDRIVITQLSRSVPIAGEKVQIEEEDPENNAAEEDEEPEAGGRPADDPPGAD